MLNITAARRNKRKESELNMTPLIDMMFIMLLFFLVTTNYVKEAGIEVNRPTAATAVVNPNASVLIAVDRDNRIFIDQREIDVRAVRANVERLMAEHPEGAVIVVADQGSSTGVAIQVMDGCRMAGAQNVSLAATVQESQ
ncbi:MAG: biopolymer transporter ExbD [Desulfatitalea sp.]